MERQGRLTYHLFSPPGTCEKDLGCHSTFLSLELVRELADQSQTHPEGFLVGRRDAFRAVNSEEAVHAIFRRPWQIEDLIVREECVALSESWQKACRTSLWRLLPVSFFFSF